MTSSKMSLGGSRNRMNLSAAGVGQQEESQVDSNERITENDSAKNASEKNSFGITRRRLLGLISRWMTLAVCMKRSPLRIW